MVINNFCKKNKNGFTLVEMLVSLTLLSIVIVIAMGLLLTANVNVKQSSTQRRVIDNLNFALEHMSRSVAYGSNFSCIPGGRLPMSCDFSMGGTQVITFDTEYLGISTWVTYQRSVDPGTGRGYISRSIGGGNPVSLTDSKIDIQELTFYVYHADPYAIDPEQPKVVVTMRGVSYAGKDPQEFFIQNTLSQRDLKL